MPARDRTGGLGLFDEAERQLNVCNSCRYCEGYCPVWPGLELRTNLTKGDMLHLGNLCHDCRDCFSACMYTAPHEFDLNPPQIFTQIREETYREFIWRPGWTGRLPRPARLIALTVLAAAFVLGLAAGAGNMPELSSNRSASAYGLVPHLELVVLMTVPVVFGLGVLVSAACRYWSATHGPLGDLLDWRAWGAAVSQSATLAHMHGGGQDCDYVEGKPSPSRRRTHHLVSYGFGLCFVSTTSAAILEQFLGSLPPYGLWSVPVVAGTVGGVMITLGCVGLLAMKRKADRLQGTETMRRADIAMLLDLMLLALTGLATLVLRHTAAFGPLLALHLAAVLATFSIFPYTKFVHWVFRVLAIYKHALEFRQAAAVPAS
ncbi:tricarballylate utilization 4Fe-4S protein TcuB [Acidiferrimicrobium sp. IK]|uniref:tricarballylate utilization 4Fe-4S protein TcuB n=1 Tax=Acidiferrimicrobium sp. IK TaxID=2871700 RepID=UPI0021CB6671|nr:tricarballylate utilization 4Fe-4S protein TcuB [Acidiferrimicrobium sp. IK]MCU4186769.1 tricarballylate utilization 4Fe-4S protein TcuB [Acidiferrimicrobium sp. IK]